jgi:hypothetical protein
MLDEQLGAVSEQSQHEMVAEQYDIEIEPAPGEGR